MKSLCQKETVLFNNEWISIHCRCQVHFIVFAFHHRLVCNCKDIVRVVMAFVLVSQQNVLNQSHRFYVLIGNSRLVVVKPLEMNGERQNRSDHCLESAVIFDLIKHSSNVSVRILYAVTSCDASISLFAFPMIKRHAVRLIDVIAK